MTRTDRATELTAFLRDYAGRRLNSRLADARRCLPPQVVLDFGRHGLFGLRVPRDLGGIDLGWQAGGAVIEQLAAIDLTLAMLVGIHNELGVGPILQSGTAQAKARLLPLLASGRMLGGLAITEQGAGSNPHAIASTAVPLAGGGWSIRGEKILVGNGSWAGVINVFARRDDEGSRKGIVGFCVSTDNPGVRMGPEMMTLGMRAIVQNRVGFDDVRVGEDEVLGNRDGNFEVAQHTFQMARLGLALTATGAIKRCAQLLVRFGSRRRIWTGALGKNTVFCHALRNILDTVDVLARLCSLLTTALDEGRDVPDEMFFVCKILAPEYLWSAADNLVQWLGGRGYLESNEAAQLLRDARLFRIFEGPTEAMKVQLGSMWQSGDAHFRAYLSGLPGGPQAIERMQEASEDIWALPLPPGVNLGQHSFSRRHAIGALVAEGVAWIMLAPAQAPAAACAALAPSGAGERAQRRFHDSWLSESHRTARATVLDLDATAHRLAIDIGDVVQTLPGEDWRYDDLLAPNPR